MIMEKDNIPREKDNTIPYPVTIELQNPAFGEEEDTIVDEDWLFNGEPVEGFK